MATKKKVAKKTKSTVTERHKRYISIMNNKGFKLVSVWVPSDSVQELRERAEKMRRNAGHVTPRANRIYQEKETQNG